MVANNKSAKLKVRQELGTFIQEIHCIYLTKGNKDMASKFGGGGKGGESDHFLPLTKIRLFKRQDINFSWDWKCQI